MDDKPVEDKLTEQQALDRAASEGIYFEDKFVIHSTSINDPLHNKSFDSRELAKKEIDNAPNSSELSLMQVRSKK